MSLSTLVFNELYYKRAIQQLHGISNQEEKIETYSDSSDDDEDVGKPFFIPHLKLLDLSNNRNLIDELKKIIPLCFKNMKIRYDKIVEFLKSQTPEYWNSDIIQLPNICLTRVDENRFKFDRENCFIKMVNRKKMVNDYIQFIQKFETLYINGLEGVGKSFIIYQMVAKMMTMEDKYRIVYVNMANRRIMHYTFETLRTIVYSDFSKNVEFKTKFLEYINLTDLNLGNYLEMGIPADVNIAFDKISLIYDFYQNIGINLIFVFDQINLILGEKKLDYQYSFLSSMVSTHKTIISASANNELNFYKLKVNYNMTPPIKLSFDEFKSFVGCYPKAIVHIKTLGDANQIMSLTGGVPLELNRFLSVQDAENLENMIDRYLVNFNDDKKLDNFSRFSIEKWYYGLQNDLEKTFAIENITKYILNLPIEPNKQGYFDKRIFVTINHDDKIYLEPFSCLAMSNALDFYSYYLKNQLIKDFQFVISRSFSYDEATIGKCVERFIIHSLCSNLEFSNRSQAKIKFPVHIFNYKEKTNCLTDFIQNIIFEDYDVCHFAGLTIPSSRKGLNRNIIFVPLDPLYPGFDFFYLQFSDKSINNQNNLFCFQITIEKKPMEHVIRNDKSFYLKKIVQQDHKCEKLNKIQLKQEKKLKKSNDQCGNGEPSENRRKKSKLFEALNAWNNYFDNNINLIEVWILRFDCLVDHNDKQHRSDRLNYMNVVDFKEIENMENVAAYFQKLN